MCFILVENVASEVTFKGNVLDSTEEMSTLCLTVRFFYLALKTVPALENFNLANFQLTLGHVTYYKYIRLLVPEWPTGLHSSLYTIAIV